MPLQAVKSRSLADQVFAQLAAEIVGAHYGPGAALPAERELAEVFGVNRHVVREALKRLAQANLVKIAQGGHTRVLDYQRHAGLEMLALLSEYATSEAQAWSRWRAVLEMRVALAGEVARLFAQRASRELRDELVQLAAQMRATSSPEALLALDLRFFERMLDGADNIAFRLAFNSIAKSGDSIGVAARTLWLQEIDRSGHRVGLAEALARGDAAAAEREIRDPMSANLADLPTAREDGSDGELAGVTPHFTRPTAFGLERGTRTLRRATKRGAEASAEALSPESWDDPDELAGSEATAVTRTTRKPG